MGLDQPTPTYALIRVPCSDLLPNAKARLMRQKQYARSLERGGKRAAAVRDWVEQAANCIQALAQPGIALRSVDARVETSGALIGDRTWIEDDGLIDGLAQGGSVTAYLVSLSFAQGAAFDWLDRDYGAHHVQSDLSNEVLFELGRIAHRLQREMNTGARLKRISVQVSDVCGQGKVWDPQKVQSLLSVFEDGELEVSVTDSGCFQPLNTLLGLTIATGG
jgi:hypothetical protein